MSDADATVPALELCGVSAGYQDVDVLHDVSLRVDPGEVVALFGANGAGKTTTLMAVSGLVERTGGTVEIFGRPAAARRRRSVAAVWRLARNGVAHVPDDRGLFADLTVTEHLRLGRPRARRGGGFVPDEQLFEWFPALRDLTDRRAGLLSGGEQQMLAIARAVVGRPRLLMIDEMSMGLAPIVARHLLDVLRAIAKEASIAVLLVEQHVFLALDVADRGYLLQHGRVVLEGTAAELGEQRGLIEAGYLGG